jgi:hypothetical protein
MINCRDKKGECPSRFTHGLRTMSRKPIRTGGDVMFGGGAFGGYTQWAVVFLIIFVLFFLLVPAFGGGASCAGGAGMGAGMGY